MMKKEFAHMKVRFIVLAVILAVLFVVSFPLGDFLIGVAENALSQSQISGLEGLQEVLGKIREDFNFNAYSQWFGKNLGQLVPIFSIIIGFPIFSREVERKTIYFLLTKQRRRRVFRVKYFLGLFAVTALIFASCVSVLLFGLFLMREVRIKMFAEYTLMMLTGGIFWYSVTILFSVFMNDQVKPLISSILILAVTTSLGFLRVFRFMSVYNYLLSDAPYRNLGIDLVYTLSLMLLSVLLYFVAWTIFRRKEF